MITLCLSFTGLKANVLKIYLNRLKLTKLTKKATGQAEPPRKRKKSDQSAAEERNSTSREKKANTQEATGPKINDTLASHGTATMRQKPGDVKMKRVQNALV